MMRSLIAIAALVAMSANADIKREDYASYEAYLAAKSAQTAAEMETELEPEQASEGEDRKVADDSEEARDGNQKRGALPTSFSEEDKEAKTITIWHTYEPRGICTLIINRETVGSKELRDGEKWIYKYEIEGTFEWFTQCQAKGGLVAQLKDGRPDLLVLRNVSSKTYACRVAVGERPTKDYIIRPDMARQINRWSLPYRWNCTGGTEYKGYIEKREG